MVRNILFLLLAPVALSGCSVFMATQGSSEIDLSVLNPGTTRKEVEQVLGRPVSPLRKGAPVDVVTYQYFSGDKANYRRAAVYGVLDVVTLGFAEIVTTPMEALQGDKNIVEVRYDRRGRVLEAKQFFVQAPMEAPEKLVDSAL